MKEVDLQVRRQSATLRGQVEDKLRRAIAVGRFKPGQRLVERELCELIGVGRTSVREALRQLEAEGLITSYPHRGPVVSTISRAEAEQLYSFRALLEGFCGRSFAEKGGPEEVAELQKAVAVFVAAAEREDREALMDSKTRFYDRIMEGGRNVFVKQTLTSLHNRITLLRMTSMTQPGRLEQSIREIGEIAAAIAAGDSERAEAACRAHVERAAVVALARLAEQEAKAVEGGG